MQEDEENLIEYTFWLMTWCFTMLKLLVVISLFNLKKHKNQEVWDVKVSHNGINFCIKEYTFGLTTMHWKSVVNLSLLNVYRDFFVQNKRECRRSKKIK